MSYHHTFSSYVHHLEAPFFGIPHDISGAIWLKGMTKNDLSYKFLNESMCTSNITTLL